MKITRPFLDGTAFLVQMDFYYYFFLKVEIIYRWRKSLSFYDVTIIFIPTY